MTGKPKEDGPEALAERLVDDLFETSDAELLEEFRKDGSSPERHAADMRARFEKILIASNKGKLTAAKAAVAADRGANRSASPIDINVARAKVRAILDRPNVTQRLSLAARKESELSDQDVLSMLEDLEELGVLPKDGDNGKS